MAAVHSPAVPWYAARNKEKPLSSWFTDQVKSHKARGKQGRYPWRRGLERDLKMLGVKSVLGDPASANSPERLHRVDVCHQVSDGFGLMGGTHQVGEAEPHDGVTEASWELMIEVRAQLGGIKGSHREDGRAL